MVLFLRKIEREPGALLCAILRAARPWQELVTDALCAEAHACVAALNAVAGIGDVAIHVVKLLPLVSTMMDTSRNTRRTSKRLHSMPTP